MTPKAVVVLIVEDHADCREMYATSLALDGFHVEKARDGVEALELAQRVAPDVVLMDLSLPGMDGIEVTRRLKIDARTREAPVIAMTAQCLQTLGDLEPAGFADLIPKPCTPDELVARVVEILARRPRGRGTA